MPEDINLTIDGREVKTQLGVPVLQAALDAGIYIPYLCYYPGMKPYGACRMCVVDVENQRGTPASCTLPAAEGMVVNSLGQGVVQLRRGVMELLLSEHPHGCLTCHRIDLCGPQDICQRHVSVTDRCVACPKNERCELKDTVRHLEMDLTSPFTYNYRNLPREVRDPYYDRDYNLCIVCARCVRACEEVRGDNAITMVERSGIALVGTSFGTSLLESGCEFCGACIDVCPTGALVERDYKWEKAARTVTTICPHCPVGCQMTIEVNQREKLIRAIPDPEGPANQGQACFKGKFGMDFVNHRERLKTPLIRRNGSLEPSTWDEALDYLAQKLAEYKGDAYGIILSPRGTNEDSYAAQKFARSVMGTNNIDISSNTRPELVEPLGEILGYQAATNPIWELEKSGCVMVVESNATEEHNVAAVPIKKAVQKGLKLIVIDSRETELTRYAHIWLRPRPGTDVTLLGGMLKVIVDESLEDGEFVSKHCQNEDALRQNLLSFDLVKVEERTGVPQALVQEAARMLAQNGPTSILYALDTLPSEAASQCVEALVDLALLTGNLGKPSSGLYPLIPGANEQGAKDMGAVPHLLPGYQPLDSPQARSALEEAWGVALPAGKGLPLGEMVQAAREGRIKALHLLRDSPNFSNGEIKDVLEAFKKVEFLIVHDNFRNELVEMAHVVLPSATFAEKDGTYTNMERRVQLLHQALKPRNGEMPEWQIFGLLAQRMGYAGLQCNSSSEVMDEIAGLTPIYAGVSHQRLESGGIQWPCTGPEDTGTPILYASEENGWKATMNPLIQREEDPEILDPQHPLILVRGRVLLQPDRDMEVVKDNGANTIKREEVIELHPSDATSLGIADGDIIEAVSEEQRFRGVARLRGPHPGVVSATYLFGQLASELEKSTEPDPMLKVPGLPLLTVRLEKVLESAAAD